ncbi:MAG: ABC transporter permease [Myxococcales bacterium]|nr:ABC transporter permease [Myxococcales bacterium]
MSGAWLIAERELRALFRSPIGYVAAAAALLIDGVWFMARALGDQGDKRLSAQVLAEFFNGVSGVTMIVAIALSMRLIAHEQEHGTLILLKTSPITDRAVVAGKFLAVFLVLTGITALTAYMPALIFVHGRVSVGHIVTGYFGILLLGAATASVGLFASALAKNQVIAAMLGAVVMGVMLLWWLLAKMTQPPISDFLEGLAIHHLRMRDFMTGVLRLENVVYYVLVAFFFLLAATKTLEARRWR